MLRTSYTRMVPVKTCRRDKKTARKTFRSVVLEKVSSSEQLKVMFVVLAVLQKRC